MHRGIALVLCLLGACANVSSPDRAPPVFDAGVHAVTNSNEPDAAQPNSDVGLVAAPLDAGIGPADAAVAHSALDCGAEQLVFQKLSVGQLKLNVGCQGSGPVIVLLHGYPEYYAAWSKLIPPLTRAGYRVIVPDQRGYNLSDKPEGVEPYAMDHLVADVRGLIAHSGEQQVLLVGHDWGGTVAWVLAHRYPELLRGLVIMAGPHPDIWGTPGADPVQDEAGSAYVPLLAGPLGELPFIFPFLRFDGLLDPYLSDAELEAYHASWAQPNAPVSMNNWYRANLYPEPRLPKGITVDVPTLVFWGEQDTFTPPSELALLPKYASKLEVVRWPDVDHWIPHQRTDELARRIIDFDE